MGNSSTRKSKKILSSRFSFCICGILSLAVGIGIGILIGYYAIDDKQSTKQRDRSVSDLLKDGDPSVSDELMNSIDADNIRAYLKDLTENPHLAGTDADFRQAKELEQFWKDAGLDEVFITPYDVLLSYPNTTNEDNMNQIQIINGANHIEYSSPLYETILDPSENKSDAVPPFNAYSAPGNVTSSELIYVNYGTVEDYRYMEDNFPSVNVSGKMVIVRYGKIFRGDKVYQAQSRGAIGIILFSDPADVAGGQTENVYPDSVFMPPSGAQRGTVKRIKGDPSTPGYPSTDTAFKLQENDPDMDLPKIPVHPIGYGIARELFAQMTGSDNLPTNWKGAMNVTYRIGGRLRNTDWKIRMRISTSNQRRTTYNVFGLIKGAIEPDRYVLFGNHRDAWVFGAIDPSSGTAVMKELSRVMGKLVKNGRWRPRRTIIFCSWGAEEYGLIGSTEWVEQYVKNLQTRAVAYVNMDIAIFGTYSITVAASPLLNEVVYESTKKVKSPDMQETYNSLYDIWSHRFPDQIDTTKPNIRIAGTYSDFAPFVRIAGVPIIDMAYSYSVFGYPLYHSKYETFNVVDRLLDPEFKYHKTMGQTAGEIIRRLADDLIVPFRVTDFSRKLTQLVNSLDTNYGELLRNNSIDTSQLDKVASNFATATQQFESRLSSDEKNDPLVVRKFNDQMTLMEKAFLDPRGLPGRPYNRHVLFAESSVDSYAPSTFPGLVDALFEIEKDTNNQEKRWKVVKKHFSVILYTIESVTSTLRDVTKFIASI